MNDPRDEELGEHDEQPEDPQIVVDEDWKDRVRRERDELRRKDAARRQAEESRATGGTPPVAEQQQDAEAAPAPEADAPEADAPGAPFAEPAAGPEAEQADSGSAERELPAPSFQMLVTTLATQAMGALGLMPDIDGKAPSPEPAAARHFIDMLGMLEEKTKGNLSSEESLMLSQVLHDLRMTFVQRDS